MIDRQIGRNAELFARTVRDINTPEARYPFLRVLVSIVEQAHPEWNHAQQKEQQIAHLIFRLVSGSVPTDEIAEVVRVRDMERGRFYD